ncbi:MAG: HIT domain-containing protein [Dehalococcoidia bacterium]
MSIPTAMQGCVFCEIVAGRSPARWESKPIVEAHGAACFHNRLRWARVMLLVIPVEHMTQEDLWTGHALGAAARMAVDMGQRHCPEGFMLLSNFGRAAHQSQEHAHIHVVSGLAAHLVNPQPAPNGQVAKQLEIRDVAIDRAPWAVRLSAPELESQAAFWTSEALLPAGATAVSMAKARSPRGFRLISNYLPRAEADDGGPPALFVLGGGQLDLYVKSIVP